MRGPLTQGSASGVAHSLCRVSAPVLLCHAHRCSCPFVRAQETQIFLRKAKHHGKTWPHLYQAAWQWREAALPGYCGETQSGITGDCQTGVSGNFWLPERRNGSAKKGEQEQSLAEQCLALCAGCARCRFVSFSAKWHDCGWFHECALDMLENKTTGFLSGSVNLSNLGRV